MLIARTLECPRISMLSIVRVSSERKLLADHLRAIDTSYVFSRNGCCLPSMVVPVFAIFTKEACVLILLAKHLARALIKFFRNSYRSNCEENFVFCRAMECACRADTSRPKFAKSIFF